MIVAEGWRRPDIDIGYALYVTPDHAVYDGMRFLVQVKGTAVAERQTTASVPKARLRQYARDALPVLIVRVAGTLPGNEFAHATGRPSHKLTCHQPQLKKQSLTGSPSSVDTQTISKYLPQRKWRAAHRFP